MNLLFVHDGPLYYDEDENYYEFAYHELKSRYSLLANNITFLMRTEKLLGTQKFTLVPKEIKVISVPNIKSPSLYLKNIKTAKVIIKNAVSNADIIVLRTQSSIAQIAFKYIKTYKKAFLVECVGCSWDAYWNYSILGKIVAPYMEHMTKKIISKSKYVYYVTTEFLQKRYPTKGKTVSCSNVVIDLPDNSILEKRIIKIKKNNLLNKIVIGTAASIDTRYKGQEYMIRAISILKKNGYNIEYRLAGGHNRADNNTFLADLANRLGVSENVVFLGNLDKNKILRFYDELDFYIQPSKQEGLPRAVIEAMSRGCPCIGANLAGIPELIQKEFLFKKGNVESLIKVFKRMINADLIKIAIENFEKSKLYNKNELNKKREVFYNEFIKDNRMLYKD